MAKKPRKAAAAEVQPEQSPSSTASQSPQPTQRQSQRTWSLLVDKKTRCAFYLVLLTALYAPLSQLILSPVYGSIPSSVYHKYGVVVSAMLSFIVKGYVPPIVPQLLAPFAMWIPVIHFFLFQLSSVFGNPLGPLVTECLTLYPLITLAIYVANAQLEALDLHFISANIREAAPSMINYSLFTIFQSLFRGLLPTWMGMNQLFTRIGLQMIIGATFTSIVPGTYIWPSLPALAFTTVANVHAPLIRTTDVLNNTLVLHNYTLIDRHESLTGYVSVLEDTVNHFRVMRCDHSLLGGEWVLPPSAKRKVAEPVYAVFTMLEAVRLVERPASKHQEKALNIGLGVGTAPSALIAHGIDTTIIEIDPTVHSFAIKYFSLPRNHAAWIGDAVGIIEQTKPTHQQYYDYIIHDVFTGGAEPASLFTHEFLSNLNEMLAPNGVIAINYAGDLATSSTGLIYRTILSVFPTCRVFREDEQIGEDGKTMVPDGGDFTNMVFICNKGSGRAVTFRKAVEADFLGSESRRAYMVPKFEVVPEKFEREGEVLTKRNVRVLEKLHVESAIGHWKLMRKVVPAAVWENW